MLDVKVVAVEHKQPCAFVPVGEWFAVKGDKVYAPVGQGICFYALSALMPVLAAWQMKEDSSDHIALRLNNLVCPQGKVVFQATRHQNLRVDG